MEQTPDPENKHAPKLSERQKDVILALLAADYTDPQIVYHMQHSERVTISQQGVNWYRRQHFDSLNALRNARMNNAVMQGFALKEQRVAALAEYAAELYARRWETDEKGRAWNGKVFLDVLDDIAQETGGRVKRLNLDIDREVEQAARRLAEIAAQVA